MIKCIIRYHGCCLIYHSYYSYWEINSHSVYIGESQEAQDAQYVSRFEAGPGIFNCKTKVLIIYHIHGVRLHSRVAKIILKNDMDLYFCIEHVWLIYFLISNDFRSEDSDNFNYIKKLLQLLPLGQTDFLFPFPWKKGPFLNWEKFLLWKNKTSHISSHF